MNPELLIAREAAGVLTGAEAEALADVFDAAAWLEERRIDGLLRMRFKDDVFEARLAARVLERSTRLRLAKQGYLQSAGMFSGLRAGLLQGLTREQLLWSPRPDMPPILWHVGHIAFTDAAAWIGAWEGDWAELEGPWQEAFRMGSPMPQAVGGWPSLQELESRGDDIRRRVGGIVDRLTPSDLERTLPHLRPGLLEQSIKTPGDVLRMLPIHHVWHTAEINVLCRLQGRPRML